MASSLVKTFDELVVATDILITGSEEVFGNFISSQIGFCKEVDELKSGNKRLKEKTEAKDIELKLSRNSLQKQMDKNALLEEKLKEYDKQFTILKMLISSDDKLINLNEAERRGLALLKQRHSMSSPGLSCTEDWGSPDTSVNVTDATDLDDDESVGCRAHWKRRRTASSEWTLDSSLCKRKRSVESGLVLSERKECPPFDLDMEEINLTPPLEKKFKRPPPGKNRRKPSQGHLIKRNMRLESPPHVPSIVPPLNLPQEQDDSPVPSAPPEVEVALVNSGILSPHSNEGTPPHFSNPDILAAFPHSPLSPLSIQPLPPTSPMTPPRLLYPSLDQEETEYADIIDYGAVVTPPRSFRPSRTTTTQSDINLTRKHNFQSKTALKVETCEVCKKKIKGFGRNFSKCKDCRASCCMECQNKVPLPCVPSVRTPKKKQKDSDLSAYCPNTIPRVPSLIVHCVKEIEHRGLAQVGIYRVPGSERTIKELKERLLKAKGSPNLDRVEDVNVLCGCIKQFLISLKEPLITTRLNPLFLLSTDEDSEEKVLACLLEAIAQLPPSNKDTLAFLILHLQKVVERSDSNRMPVESIARVFGPTLVGSASNDPAIAVKDLPRQKAVVERFLKISPAYWRQYLSPDDTPDAGSPRRREQPISATSTPLFNSPSTPELMPIPQSPFLGPCQSPRTNRGYAGFAKTPVVTRSTSASANITSSVSRSAKKNGFFAAIN